MNEIHIARLKAYKCMLNLPRLAENKKLKQNRWATAWDQSSVSTIYGEIYGGKDLRMKCVLSLEWKREGVIDGDRGGDDSVDPTCVVWWEGERPGCGW